MHYSSPALTSFDTYTTQPPPKPLDMHCNDCTMLQGPTPSNDHSQGFDGLGNQYSLPALTTPNKTFHTIDALQGSSNWPHYSRHSTHNSGFGTATIPPAAPIRLSPADEEQDKECYSAHGYPTNPDLPTKSTSCSKAAVQWSFRKEQNQPSHITIPDTDLSYTEKTLISLLHKGSLLSWTMLLPFGEDSQRLTYAWKGKLEDFLPGGNDLSCYST